MIPSPYTSGSFPRVLVGRDAELDEVRTDLARVLAYGDFIGRIRVETGPRGAGKRSLLKTMRDMAAEHGFITAMATARSDDSLIHDLVYELDQGIDSISARAGQTDQRRLRDRIGRLRLQLGVGVARAGVDVDVSTSPPPAPSAHRAFSEFITTCAADLRTLGYAWQEMQGQYDEPPAALITAGLPDSPDILTDAVTFSERFAFRPLSQLTETDAARVLTDTAALAGVSWDPQLVSEVVARARGYPYFLQLYGDAIWRTATPASGDTLTSDYLAEAERIIGRDIYTMFRARWAKATHNEQRLLAAMAQSGDQPVRRRDIVARLATPSDISVPRRRLIDKGIIEPAGYGYLRFTTPGYATFIQDEAENNDAAAKDSGFK